MNEILHGQGGAPGDRPRQARPPAWTHEVVVMRPRSDAEDTPLERQPPLLRRLLESGDAQPVFDATSSAPQPGESGFLPEVIVVRLNGEEATRTVLERLQREDRLAEIFVAPPRYVLQRASRARGGRGGMSMNDWGMAAVGRDLAKVDASGITIAVVDSGVDAHHPDLVGVIADYVNCCVPESDKDLEGHGTHVCGILAASGKMRGVSNARLAVFKGLGQHYSAANYYRALRGACIRAKIVNLSLGGPALDPVEELIIKAAVGSGVLVVAATGNEDDDGSYPWYPAALAGVLAVGAVDDKLARADFSNFGPHVALVAPGVDIWSTVPTYQSVKFGRTCDYGACEGTSMAAPFVSGMAACLAAQLGTTDARTIREKLPVKRCPGQSCRTEELGAGLLHWTGPLELSQA